MNYLKSYNICFCYFGVYLFLINFSNICGQFAESEYKLTIRDNGLETDFIFKRVDNSFLANKWLPIFATKYESDALNPYKKVDDVMGILGDIIPYHNYEQLAAVMHAPSLCDCLNGVIDSRYVIRDFPIALIHDIQEIGVSAYIKRRSNIHTNLRPTEQASNGSMVTKFETPHEAVVINPIQMNRTIYPEVLVVLRNDISSFTSTGDPQKILNVISLLNAVDMLFSIAEHPHVKLNIAGIILEENKDRLPFIKSKNSKNEIEVKNTVEAILSSDYTYFEKSKLHPNISFDYVLFITSNKLKFETSTASEELQRMSAYPKIGVHNATLAFCNFSKPITFVTDNNEFNSYATIAHEIFHLMSKGAHAGTTVTRDKNDKCSYQYLDRLDTRIFESFKWSFDCCMLANKPQSLNIPHSRMSLREQCKCYGFKPHATNENYVCTDLLYCEDDLEGLQFNALIQEDPRCENKTQMTRPMVELASAYVPWIQPSDYRRLFYIFSGPKGHTQLTCYGLLIRENVVITAKDCIKKTNEIRMFSYSRIQRKFIQAAFNSNISSTDDITSELALIFFTSANLAIKYLQIETDLNTVEQLHEYNIDSCVLIDMTSLSVGEMDVQYFPINITFEDGIKSKEKIKPIKTKGNPLMCHIFDNKGHHSRAALVGILVSDNDYFKFANLKDNLMYINPSIEHYNEKLS